MKVKGTDGTHILNSRRWTLEAKEEGQFLRELQHRYGRLFINQGEC